MTKQRHLESVLPLYSMLFAIEVLLQNLLRSNGKYVLPLYFFLSAAITGAFRVQYQTNTAKKIHHQMMSLICVLGYGTLPASPKVRICICSPWSTPKPHSDVRCPLTSSLSPCNSQPVPSSSVRGNQHDGGHQLDPGDTLLVTLFVRQANPESLLCSFVSCLGF